MSILDQLIRKVSAVLKNNSGSAVSAVKDAVTSSSKTIVFEKLPKTLEELKLMPEAALKDPFCTAALTVAVLCEYPANKEAALEMLDYLKGPRPLTPLEKSFINDRFMDGVDYVPRSYLSGTSPENNYTPSTPYSLKIYEHAHSRDNYKDGYLRLFITSSGADSQRFVDLRLKPSTDQWFLWEFGGLLLGIRQPKCNDPWA